MIEAVDKYYAIHAQVGQALRALRKRYRAPFTLWFVDKDNPIVVRGEGDTLSVRMCLKVGSLVMEPDVLEYHSRHSLLLWTEFELPESVVHGLEEVVFFPKEFVAQHAHYGLRSYEFRAVYMAEASTPLGRVPFYVGLHSGYVPSATLGGECVKSVRDPFYEMMALFLERLHAVITVKPWKVEE